MTQVLNGTVLDASPDAARDEADRQPVRAALSGLLVTALAIAAVFVLHRGWVLLDYPYWLDEAWVALSVQRPFGELPGLTSATPLGWTALLRIPAALPGDPLRLLPLAFHAAAVVAAFSLGRTVHGSGRRPWTGGALFAGVLACAPFLLARDDLKPYTADAFAVALAMLLVARLDREWSTRGVWSLALSTSSAMLLSQAAAFACAAALIAVFMTQVVRRHWRRAAMTAAAGVTAAAVLSLVYVLAVLPATNEALTDYWVDYYLPTDLAGIRAFLGLRAADLPALFGLPSWWVFGPLLAAGAVALVAQRLPSVLLTALLLVVLALAGGVLEAYPLLDQRTSTFLYTGAALVLAAGLLGMAQLLSRVHVAFAALAIVSYAVMLGPDVGQASRIDVPFEDVRTPVQYLETNASPDDVIVVGSASAYAYAYYAPGLPVAVNDNDETAVGYSVSFPGTRVLAMSDRRPEVVRRVMVQACVLAGPGGRVWRVHAHLSAAEFRVYTRLEQEGRHTVASTPVADLVLLTCAE